MFYVFSGCGRPIYFPDEPGETQRQGGGQHCSDAEHGQTQPRVLLMFLLGILHYCFTGNNIFFYCTILKDRNGKGISVTFFGQKSVTVFLF